MFRKRQGGRGEGEKEAEKLGLGGRMREETRRGCGGKVEYRGKH